MKISSGIVKLTIIISIFLMIASITFSYAYFTTSNTYSDASFSSANSFSNMNIYNVSNFSSEGMISSINRDGGVKKLLTASVVSDIMSSLYYQINLNNTTFDISDYRNIKYEIFAKPTSDYDTSSSYCNSNTYYIDINQYACTTGNLNSSSLINPLLENYELKSGDNYFDIYIWIDSNKIIDVGTNKINFDLFFTSESNITSVFN